MTLSLFLVDHLPATDQVVLDGDEGRHAARVKRLAIGEQILVGDGRGSIATCTVRMVGPDRVEATVGSRRVERLPDPRLVVVQALPKGDRAELAVELLTELGADEIVPWAASRSVPHWRHGRETRGLDRWRRTAREAAKQSRRAWLPVIHDLASTDDVAARLAASTVLVLHESASSGLSAAALPSSGTITLVVGPEGGITDQELAAFGPGRAVRLGDPVLRTSTAGAAALAVLAARLGRWG